MKRKNKIRNNSSLFLFIIAILLLIITKWFNQIFSNVSIDEIIFQLKVPMQGTNIDFMDNALTYIKDFIPLLIILSICVYIYQSDLFKHSYQYLINLKIKNKEKQIKINIKDDTKIMLIINIILFIVSITNALLSLDIDKYIYNTLNASTIFEEYYIDPRTINLEFPKEKRNLIYIYLESMESNYYNLNNHEIEQNNLIPNLEKIANENIHFSNNDYLGGAHQINGTQWTIASLVSQTSGVPLKLAINGNMLSEYSEFLPGLYSLGNILNKNGYKQYFMIGSDSVFGGRKNYFSQHGNYEIYDYYSAIEEEKIPSDYFVWWGYEDNKLIEYAKEKLLEISKNDEPFNFTLLTADTHFLEGYTDESCERISENNYANAVYCSDKLIGDFINWIKQQDFYENTTIIISGDHLVMSDLITSSYEKENRHIYNAIINSSISTENTKNKDFTTLDMFPTTLASIGVKIPGERLGLGTNLFSSKPTLIEEFGIEEFKNEIEKKSNYYDKNITYNKKKA